MRVTEPMRYRTFLADLNQTSEVSTKLAQQAATGRRLSKPSDSPVDSVRQLRMRRQIDMGNDLQERLAISAEELKRSELVLDDAVAVYQRAKELAIEGATGARTDADYEAIAIEAEQLFRDLVGLANRQVDGRFVFSGTKTTTQPFTINGNPPTGVTYNGNSDARTISPSPGLTVQTSMPGDEMFMTGTNVFDELLNLRDRALAHDVDGMANTTASALDAGFQKLVNKRTEVGALSGSVSRSADTLAQQVLDDEASLADLEDVDLVETIVQLELAKNSREAALQVAAQVARTSLLDFLA